MATTIQSHYRLAATSQVFDNILTVLLRAVLGGGQDALRLGQDALRNSYLNDGDITRLVTTHLLSVKIAGCSSLYRTGLTSDTL